MGWDGERNKKVTMAKEENNLPFLSTQLFLASQAVPGHSATQPWLSGNERTENMRMYIGFNER